MTGPGGRPPKPTALKALTGNPGHRPLPKDEAVAPEVDKDRRGVPKAPSWLKGRGRRQWARIAPILDRMGLLTAADQDTLALMCDALAEYQDAQDVIRAHGRTYRTLSAGIVIAAAKGKRKKKGESSEATDQPSLFGDDDPDIPDVFRQAFEEATAVDPGTAGGKGERADELTKARKAAQHAGNPPFQPGMIRMRPEVAIAADAWRRFHRMAVEFGLTPSARVRVHGQGKEDDDPFELLMRKREERRGKR